MGFALSDMQLTSPAFTAGGAIPSKHTGEGEDISPALSWTNAPAGTKSFAVICHDPDAPLISPDGTYGYVHWTVYNIPAEASGLAEGCTDYTRGKNDFGHTNYGGPMPPPGHGVHYYYFWILALDSMADLQAGLSMQELLRKLEPHCLGMNRLVGTYERNQD